MALLSMTIVDTKESIAGLARQVEGNGVLVLVGFERI